MRAGILAAALALAVVTAGCGGGGTNSTPGSTGGGGSSVYTFGPATNAVLEFSQNSSGALIPLSTPTTFTGSVPVAMVLHPSLKLAFIVNNADGTVTVRVRDTSTGILSVPPLPPGVLNPPPPIIAGISPIAMVMTPNGNFVYVLNQNTNTVGEFSVDTVNNTLNSVGTLTLGALPAGQFMAVSSDSAFLYISSPTTGKIAVSSIATAGGLGTPTVFTVGATPSVMLVDPQVRFLYVTDPPTNAVRVFSLSGGAISSQVSGSPFATGTNPSAMAINSSGNFLLVTNKGSNSVSGFSVSNGSLSNVPGSPFNTGVGPSFVVFDKANSFVYVADQGSNDIAAYQLTGTQLRSLVGAPFSVGTSPTWIVTSP